MSVETVDGILKLAIQCSMKVMAILVAVFLAVGIALGDLDQVSVIMAMYLFPPCVLGKGPSRETMTHSRGPATENSRSFPGFLFVQGLHVQNEYLAIVLYTSLAMLDQ